MWQNRAFRSAQLHVLPSFSFISTITIWYHFQRSITPLLTAYCLVRQWKIAYKQASCSLSSFSYPSLILLLSLQSSTNNPSHARQQVLPSPLCDCHSRFHGPRLRRGRPCRYLQLYSSTFLCQISCLTIIHHISTQNPLPASPALLNLGATSNASPQAIA